MVSLQLIGGAYLTSKVMHLRCNSCSIMSLFCSSIHTVNYVRHTSGTYMFSHNLQGVRLIVLDGEMLLSLPQVELRPINQAIEPRGVSCSINSELAKHDKLSRPRLNKLPCPRCKSINGQGFLHTRYLKHDRDNSHGIFVAAIGETHENET